VTEVPPLVLWTPHAPSGALSGRVIAKALRDNAILAFPPEAFDEEVVYRSFFGRQQIILNRPAGIHHILVDNPDNYRRTPATMRMLRPLLGNGLLLSQGEEWKHQRRTVAPAFAPRMMPLLTHHIARAAETTVASLAAPPSGKSTCLRRCNLSPWRLPAPRCFPSRWSGIVPNCAS